MTKAKIPRVSCVRKGENTEQVANVEETMKQSSLEERNIIINYLYCC